MGPEPIWGSTSNVPFLGRCRAPGELSQFLKWVAFITVMNALQRNDMGADTVLANDNYLERRDPAFEVRMRDVLLVYQEVALQNEAPRAGPQRPPIITVSVDEK